MEEATGSSSQTPSTRGTCAVAPVASNNAPAISEIVFFMLWPPGGSSVASCRRRLLARRSWRDDAFQPQVDGDGPVHLVAMNTQADGHQAARALDGPDLHQLQHALISHGGDVRIAEGRGFLEQRDQHRLRAGCLLLFGDLRVLAALE